MIRHPVRFLAAGIVILPLWFSQIPSAKETNVIMAFSAMDPTDGIPSSWKPLNFPKIPEPTTYRLRRIDNRTVIEARSHGGASGLVHAVDVDPFDFPWLSWQWRVDHALDGSDVTTKAGDDCAARIYVAFKFDGRNKSWWQRFKHGTKRFFVGHEIPGSALVYAWASGVRVGAIIDSPYTDQSKLIVVQSGNRLKGQWINENRNVVDDYHAAYGVLPPDIMGIAIMTDTDNTGAAATAHYGDIRLEKTASGIER